MALVAISCPVCGGVCLPLDVVDFNKSCEEAKGLYLPLSGIPVYYFLCGQCGFCLAPEFGAWTMADFEDKIYNGDYVQVDPDYVDSRPRANAQSLVSMFAGRGAEISHLDYGGGGGLLSELLRQSNWQSRSYDPFVDRETGLGELGKFDLITAFEVFEHVPDVRQLAANLSALLADDGVVLFSTLVSDGNLAPRQRVTWWYASPRNGHISLFSKQSLAVLGASQGFNFGSFSPGFHAYWRQQVPPWASHLIKLG